MTKAQEQKYTKLDTLLATLNNCERIEINAVTGGEKTELILDDDCGVTAAEIRKIIRSKVGKEIGKLGRAIK